MVDAPNDALKKMSDAAKAGQTDVAKTDKGNNPSDMRAAAPGSQRTTNQPDASDLDSTKAPAAGTGDTGAGLAADGRGKQKVDAGKSAVASGQLKKANEPVKVKRLLGTEEIEVMATRGTLHVLDRNGRKLAIGQTVNLPVRIVGLNSAQEIEVVYPPYLPALDEAPVYKDGNLQNADGSAYTGTTYKLNDKNEVVNSVTNQAPVKEEVPEQQTLTVDAVRLERF